MAITFYNYSIPEGPVKGILGFSTEKHALAAVSKAFYFATQDLIENDFKKVLSIDLLLPQKLPHLSGVELKGRASQLQMIFLAEFVEWMIHHQIFNEDLSWFSDPTFLPEWSLKYKHYLLYQLKTRKDYPVEKAPRQEIKVQLLKAHQLYGSQDRFLLIDLVFFQTMRSDCISIAKQRCSYYLFEKFMPIFNQDLNVFIQNIIKLSQNFGGQVPYEIQKRAVEIIINYRSPHAFETFLRVLEEQKVDSFQILALMLHAITNSLVNDCFDILCISHAYLKSHDPANTMSSIHLLVCPGDPAIIRYCVSQGQYRVNNTTVPLNEVTISGNTDALSALIQLGAPLHKDHIYHAATRGYVWMVERILRQPHVKVDQTYAQKKTLLGILAEQVQSPVDAERLEPVIQVLLQFGASLDHEDRFHHTPRQTLLNSPSISADLRGRITPVGNEQKSSQKKQKIQ
ncbi:MAG: hypothetical protein JSR58_06470 [Verrucomicrobia bacterium]|nr:hypothetical protein [Verrucomicrobiota bacterium]